MRLLQLIDVLKAAHREHGNVEVRAAQTRGALSVPVTGVWLVTQEDVSVVQLATPLPAATCGHTANGSGPCVKPPGHDGFHEDAPGTEFTQSGKVGLGKVALEHRVRPPGGAA